jgi:hypothetical protein
MDEFDPKSRLINIPGRGRGQYGGAYLPTRQRMLWFRAEHPNGSIETEIVKLTDDLAVFKASVGYPIYTPRLSPEEGQWVDYVKCVGHGSETKGDFPDYIEKAETKAIGRALAAAGFGTEAAFEESEGRPADAPVTPKVPELKQGGMSTQNQLKQLSDLVIALKMQETIGPHITNEYGVDDTTFLTFDEARELIARLRVKLEKQQAAAV